jgi:hypothetical protein
MKILIIIAAILATGCATEHRASTQDLRNVYIDCTNRQAFENYYNKQLRLTDTGKATIDPVEQQYYAAIKEKLWTLRTVCK